MWDHCLKNKLLWVLWLHKWKVMAMLGCFWCFRICFKGQKKWLNSSWNGIYLNPVRIVCLGNNEWTKENQGIFFWVHIKGIHYCKHSGKYTCIKHKVPYCNNYLVYTARFIWSHIYNHKCIIKFSILISLQAQECQWIPTAGESHGTDSLLECPERIFANFPPPEMLFKPRKEGKRYKLREREKERKRKRKEENWMGFRLVKEKIS